MNVHVHMIEKEMDKFEKENKIESSFSKNYKLFHESYQIKIFLFFSNN